MRTSSPVSHVYCTYRARAAKGLFLVLLFCALWAAPGQGAPDEFVHGRPELGMNGGLLTLHLPLSVDNEDALGELLRDGASLELSIKVNIHRKRSLWFNENIHEARFSSLLRHDPLSREYRMTMPGGEQIFQDKNLRALLARTWKDLNLPLAPGNLFKPKNNYIVKVELSLKHTALPPWLDRTLVFWNKDVVNSISFELEYRTENASVSR